MTMEIYVNRGDALRVIRSFISGLRPESTGLICEICDAILKMDYMPVIDPNKEEKEDV